MCYGFIKTQQETAKHPTASSMSAYFQWVAKSHVKTTFSIGCVSVTPRINIATFPYCHEG